MDLMANRDAESIQYLEGESGRMYSKSNVWRLNTSAVGGRRIPKAIGTAFQERLNDNHHMGPSIIIFDGRLQLNAISPLPGCVSQVNILPGAFSK